MNSVPAVVLMLLTLNAAEPADAVCCKVAHASLRSMNAHSVDAARPSAAVGEIAVAWPGEDRYRHFWASYGATAMTFGAVRAVDRDAAMPAAIATAAVLGLAKEVHDGRRGGFFDVIDLVADAAGIAAAYFFLREIR